MSHRIVATGLGLVSPLGRDVVTTCASARAGLVRVDELLGIQVVDPDTEEVELITGCPISGLTDGFAGLGRLTRLGLAGLRDLLSKEEPNDWSDTGLFLNLSSGFLLEEWDRIERTKQESVEEEFRGVLPYEIERRNEIYRLWLLPTILRYAQIGMDSSSHFLQFGDRAGFVTLLRHAADALRGGYFQRCIVGGIDSLVEVEMLQAAYAFGLLKTPSRAVGFIPAECASFLLIEREEDARRRGAEIWGVIEAPTEQSELSHRLSGETPSGIALADAISGTLGGLVDGGAQTGLIVGCLNGDPFYAREWGNAIVRLRANHLRRDVPEWSPAAFFGEIGAASGPAAACLAMRGLNRGYAGTDNVLVWLASDSGGRGSFYIRNFTA